ncbi:MAG: HPF/RaiA family ribosome-associated protein [Planctomycetota bacterium]
MDISIRSAGVSLDRAAARRFIADGFARLVPAPRRVEVDLSDVNGPRGGVDTRCALRIEMPGAGVIVSEERGENGRLALGRALGRAMRALRRRLDRRPRGRPRAPRN